MTRRSFFATSAAVLAQSPATIRLVIIGDDIGAAHAIGEGTILAYRNGIMRSANLIVPGPWLLEAVQQFAENPGLAVGVHLDLTSEWDSVKWRPLTSMPSLVDLNGFLPPRTKDVAAPTVKLNEVEREMRAQIETAKRLVPRAAWLSAHMGAVTATPALRDLTLKLSVEYKLPMQNEVPGMKMMRAPYSGTSSDDDKVNAMLALIEGLQPGTYGMIDHPATDTPEMRRVGHPGNTNVAEQRSGVLRAWTNPRLIAAIKKRNIQLASVAEALIP